MAISTLVPVDRTAKCKRCGAEQLAWLKSKKGKWYLADAFRDPDTHELFAAPMGFHKCNATQSETGNEAQSARELKARQVAALDFLKEWNKERTPAT